MNNPDQYQSSPLFSNESEPLGLTYGTDGLSSNLQNKEDDDNISYDSTHINNAKDDNDDDLDYKSVDESTLITKKTTRNNTLRRVALDLSLYVNLFILATKLYAYLTTLSLSVLAALVDSILDVVSQLVLNYTERHSSLSRSSALYPAGASRLEPVGVLTCAALMGMASFEILKESIESLVFDGDVMSRSIDEEHEDGVMMSPHEKASVLSMASIVIVKLALYILCQKAIPTKIVTSTHSVTEETDSLMVASISSPATTITSTFAADSHTGEAGTAKGKQAVKASDPTLEALALDHWNDCLSNLVAAVALLFTLVSPKLWFLDPAGAIIISLYIIHSWYETGKEQIEQLTGKSAPDEFIQELSELASNFDERMVVDHLRVYHFGPKFLVEVEVVLPKDTLLFESHDLGMELQYEIEGREEVERCFVHIDYERRPYDEHVVSKVPELRAKYVNVMSSIHSV